MVTYVPLHACYKTRQSACEDKSCAKENWRAMGALNWGLLTDDFNRFVVAVQKRTQQKQNTMCFANAITTTHVSHLGPVWTKAAEVVKVYQSVREMHHSPVSFSSVHLQTRIFWDCERKTKNRWEGEKKVEIYTHTHTEQSPFIQTNLSQYQINHLILLHTDFYLDALFSSRSMIYLRN